MTEAFLHHIWKFRLYDKNNLATTESESIEVLKTGQHNSDAGPDFFNAQLKIGETVWAGNVEIHLRSSDWNRHHHTDDASYNNVVLHVVYEDDADVFTKANIRIQTLELKGRFDPRLFESYQNLVGSNRWVPCAGHIGKVDGLTVSGWLERLAVERLENKTAAIADSLKLYLNNWEEIFYHQLAKNFGFSTNALPFEMLAQSLPLSILSRHKDQLHQVEALLFGQSGLLDQAFKDDYPNSLKKEALFLQKKFLLTPMDGSRWKFLRLRPSNFPTIRIAQFARLMHKSSGLFSRILETQDTAELADLFTVAASGYWETHYTFDKPSGLSVKVLGETATMAILINTVVPMLFAYGRHRHEEIFQDRAIKLLENLSPESNAVISEWNNLGITSGNANRTQALLQLKNEYCDRKKCLLCSIGNKIINTNQ